MLSVIIPSYKDPLLQKTINSVLQNFEGDFEIIAVLDGYWPTLQLEDHPRLRILHLGKNQGMRAAINAGVAVSKGEYIMRTDEHCVFAKGFDSAMLETLEDDWIMTAKRFFLDVEKWEVMNIPPIEYEKLVIDEKYPKFTGHSWKSRNKSRKDKMIDETMAMQGSCWIMKRLWWDKVIGELQSEGYGILYQDSTEMIFKTWKAGGKLMLNKNTWFAHKHRQFNRTHNYSGDLSRSSWEYALKTWRDYYENVIRPKWEI